MARSMGASVGREVLLARTILGLSRRRAAGLARVSPDTLRRVEDGDPSVAMDTACRIASAVGLKVWAKAFPAAEPTLRDTGQLRIANYLRELAHAAYSVTLELRLANGRSADEVFFGPHEIVHAEIERRLADWQGQYRPAVAKRVELASRHQRPVRLVIVVEDTERNRRVAREHAALIESTLPAGSREVMRALRTGKPIGRDGILWVRPRDHR
jgi:transcriptional regulator with XRE-family HTH domain